MKQPKTPLAVRENDRAVELCEWTMKRGLVGSTDTSAAADQ